MLWETGGKKINLGKVEKSPNCPQLIKLTRAEHCLQIALGLRGQADTQTDAEAFVPYGTASARHKEQPSHAENRPTKREAVCEQFAGSTPGVLSVRTCFQQWLGLTLHILGQGAEMQYKNPGGIEGLAHPSAAADKMVHPLPKKCS